MDSKIEASLILHAVGDTIGYNGGRWEFNYGNTIITEMFAYELLSEFINLGGINCIDLSKWWISDDTVLHLAVGEALIESNNTSSFIKKFRKNLVDSYEDIKKRHPGVSTITKITNLKNIDINALFKFDKNSGGSGASMRSPVFGLYFRNPKDINKLMESCILSSIITHNHPTGYLGGLATALFTHYAINDIPIDEWGFKMIDFIQSDTLDKFMKEKVHYYYNIHKKYKHSFIGKWKAYLKDKFGVNNDIHMTIINIAKRSRYYLDNYSSESNFIGSSGDDSLIIAYDSLLDSEDCFEKLIVYSMLHIGDTDTTGCIAGALYGAKYGFKNIPNNLIENIEYKERIKNLSDRIKKR